MYPFFSVFLFHIYYLVLINVIREVTKEDRAQRFAAKPIDNKYEEVSLMNRGLETLFEFILFDWNYLSHHIFIHFLFR